MINFIKSLIGIPLNNSPEYRYRPEYKLSQTVIIQKELQSKFILEGVNYPPHPPLPPSCRITDHWGVELSRSKEINIKIRKVNQYNIENRLRHSLKLK